MTAHRSEFHSHFLHEAGLPLQAAIPIADLPSELHAELLQACPHAKQFRQLLLIANAGPRFWQAAQDYWRQKQNVDSEYPLPAPEHPLDQFARHLAEQLMQEEIGKGIEYEVLYPGAFSINLQSLGQLLGWHTISPLMIGIHRQFGLWSAYRILMLANTDFASSLPKAGNTDAARVEAPCDSCRQRGCVQACPAQAIDEMGFHLAPCLEYRQRSDSLCRDTCVARLACPVGSEHRYSTEQIAYHYSQSLRMLGKV